MSEYERKLNELGIILPNAPVPAANYVPFVKVDNIVYVSGQISIGSDGLIKGVLGADMSIEDGRLAARQCAINLLAQVKAACDGNLDRLLRVIKLGGFVNSKPNFSEQPNVINGASDFLVDLLGDRGRHARTAVGAILPLGVAVEIDGIFLIK
ncbi:MAG: RidA family protein [Paracoccaceae bacterium]|jgi:enamine deaminase RidA (YjgF/YER057c/UK114 family)|nr:RidA family protein [Paracoccaceae bacterium]|tara:strand:+ start:151 stop:609 length:459 start_codon:yes stop_codon:yes gene_type:complete